MPFENIKGALFGTAALRAVSHRILIKAWRVVPMQCASLFRRQRVKPGKRKIICWDSLGLVTLCN